MEKELFKPVILGTDIGAYSVARTLHKFYNVKATIVCRNSYWMTSYSNITECNVIDNMTDEGLIEFLLDYGKNHNDIKLLLFGCTEEYVDIIIQNKQTLEQYYIIPTVDLPTLKSVVLKENFYALCERINVSYPKTLILNNKNYDTIEIPFDYPIIAKVSDDAEYLRAKFEGKRKVYIINDHDELIRTIKQCYTSTYQGDFIIQEFIPGDDTNMRVLTCFCDKDSNVLFSSVGQILLEEMGPNVTGNYAAIVNSDDEEIVEAAKKIVKEAHYVGYANFDIKYDCNTKKFYFFELNARLGRSNFYMGAANTNYLAPLIDTFIYENPQKEYKQNGPEVYQIISNYTLKKYLNNKEILQKIKHLKRNNPLYYENDKPFKRLIYIRLAVLNHIKKYKKYYGKI